MKRSNTSRPKGTPAKRSHSVAQPSPGSKGRSKSKSKENEASAIEASSFDSLSSKNYSRILKKENDYIDKLVDKRIALLEDIRSELKRRAKNEIRHIWKSTLIKEKKASHDKGEIFFDYFHPTTGGLKDLWSTIIEFGFQSAACDWTYGTLLNLSLTCKAAGIFLFKHWWDPVRESMCMHHSKRIAALERGKSSVEVMEYVAKKYERKLNAFFCKKANRNTLKVVKTTSAKKVHVYCMHCRSLMKHCRNYANHFQGFDKVILKKDECGFKIHQGLSENVPNFLFQSTYKDTKKYNVQEVIDVVDELFPQDWKMPVYDKLARFYYEVKLIPRHRISLQFAKPKAKKVWEDPIGLKWPPKRKLIWEKNDINPLGFGYNTTAIGAPRFDLPKKIIIVNTIHKKTKTEKTK